MNDDEIQDVADWTLDRMGVWARRANDEACQGVAAGSALAAPEVIGPEHNTARVVWRALQTAGEHAGLAYYMTVGHGFVPTNPYLSLARAALLGAGRALYLLEPDTQDEREARTLRFMRTEAGDLLRVVDDASTALGHGADMEELRADVKQQQAECDAALEARGLHPRVNVTETDMLKAIAGHLGADEHSARLKIMNLWRMGSGMAHARAWAWERGLEAESATTRLAVIWSTPMGLLESAWELWCERRGDHTDISP